MARVLNTPSHSGNKNAGLKSILAFIVCILIPLTVGGISAYITSREINGGWFNSLEKPAFQPPDKLFAPVWTTLYILMGISLYLVWKSPKSDLRKSALWLFGIQLFLNFWWSILFFSFHLLFLSIIDISVMWILIFYMILLFRKTKPSAGYLNIPYLLWISFATVLNIFIWIFN
ncbi:MAG: tryptophan-rich sensory protein [Bacteroidetes bacterium]|nr:tryptophan-rich sensory protein [Bacteroidota bacterium]